MLIIMTVSLRTNHLQSVFYDLIKSCQPFWNENYCYFQPSKMISWHEKRYRISSKLPKKFFLFPDFAFILWLENRPYYIMPFRNTVTVSSISVLTFVRPSYRSLILFLSFHFLRGFFKHWSYFRLRLFRSG